MTKIYAPNTALKGPKAGVVFKDGVGDTEDQGAIAYFARAGYGIGIPAPIPVSEPVIDARSPLAGEVLVGTPLRDAAVDPRARDFLAPTNAGEADPHGPLVVGPGIHGVGPKPIRPGEVFVDKPKRQDDEETDLAEAVLVEGQLATIVSVSSERPTDRDTKPAWVSFAVSQGMTEDEAEAATKADLIERFG